jgi:hypothetical protein
MYFEPVSRCTDSVVARLATLWVVGPVRRCMKPLIPLLIPCLVLQVAACAAELPTTATSNEAKAAQGNNALAIELYVRLRKQSGGPKRVR